MEFGLSESQQILKDTARKFFAGECPMPEVRPLMETETAYDKALWEKMAAQGFTGIIFAEEFGGMGLGVVELALLMEEAGYALLPGPLFSTIWAGSMMDACGSEQQKQKYLPKICSGQTRGAVAFLETGTSWNLDDLKLSGSTGKLTGSKLFVCDAAIADFLVVPCADGVYFVSSGASGLKITPMKGMDLTRKIYSVQFSNTPAEKLAGNLSSSARALEMATVALTAELAGSMQRVLELTVGYAKTRKQFGKPIGSFQAVQHMCADMYLETESVRSSAYYSAWALQENTADASVAVSIAKMYASDAARNTGNRGIQVHGGMGFTWENDVHLYYRRAKASETMLGDATFHRERIAQLVVDGKSIGANL
ncbi:MAG TPA: acyl-CoA dehydrogenase family protein [Candidatus Limnocylindrales bacterium]|jgi:alkylation response protein AidB-like acyl-CoA dehydrogenase|nr:acyl-CoA dehydrogenase family protein [Candidatus Limnocylindrales bacterium]